MSDAPDAIITTEGAVLRIQLNRPHKLNAINKQIESLLRDAVSVFEVDPQLRALLIIGTGRYFSAGYDLTYRVDADQPSSGIALRWQYREIHDLFDRFENVEKPVIVAINGPCLGGGLEFALSCDFRLAADTAVFGLPEVSLAALAGSGGTSRLTRTVGPAWARWIAMAGQKVDAARALQMGLIHDVYPAAEFEARVQEFAQHLAGLPADAMGASKLAIELCADLGRAGGRNVERMANTALLSSPEYQAMVAAAKERVMGV